MVACLRSSKAASHVLVFLGVHPVGADKLRVRRLSGLRSQDSSYTSLCMRFSYSLALPSRTIPKSRGCPVRSSNHCGSHASISSCASSFITRFSSSPQPSQSPSSTPRKSTPAQSSCCSRNVSSIARQNSVGYSWVTLSTLLFSCTCVSSWLHQSTQDNMGSLHVRQKPRSFLSWRRADLIR